MKKLKLSCFPFIHSFILLICKKKNKIKYEKETEEWNQIQTQKENSVSNIKEQQQTNRDIFRAGQVNEKWSKDNLWKAFLSKKKKKKN